LAQVLSITFPIFAVIGIGYAVVKVRLFGAEDLSAVGKFVLNLALPAALFSGVAKTRIAEIADPAYLAAYAGGGLATIAVGWAVLRLQRVAPARTGAAVLGAAAPNSVFVGFPIMLLAYPAVAAKVLALNLIVENFLIIPLALALMSAEAARKVSAAAFLRDLAWDMLKRPMILGLLAGLAVSLSGIGLPSAIDRLTGLLGTGSAGLALFFIGGSLARLPLRGNRLVAAEVVAGKLVLHPAAVALAIWALPFAGLALAPELVAPLVLTAAMPMIGIYAILASEVGHEGMASIALIAATGLSFLTLSALLAALG